MPHVEPPGSSRLRIGWPGAAGGHGHSRDPAAHERCLLVGVEGESEAHELLETARAQRFAVAFPRERRSQRLDEPRRGRAGGVSAENEPRSAATADRVEVDDAEDLGASRLLYC